MGLNRRFFSRPVVGKVVIVIETNRNEHPLSGEFAPRLSEENEEVNERKALAGTRQVRVN